MNKDEINDFLTKCKLDPNEKLSTSDDSWWRLNELISHAFEVHQQTNTNQSAFDYLQKNEAGMISAIGFNDWKENKVYMVDEVEKFMEGYHINQIKK